MTCVLRQCEEIVKGQRWANKKAGSAESYLGTPADRPQGAVSVFLDLALKGAPLPVRGDSSVVRGLVRADDLAKAVVSVAVRSDVDGALNIGSGTGASLRK